MTTSTVESTKRDMGANVELPAYLRHPKTGGVRRKRIADALNVSLAAAEKLIYGERAINLLYARVIESDLRAHDHEAVALWVSPADAAMMGDDVPHLYDAWNNYDAEDVREDVTQAPLNRRDPATLTDAELETYARAVARELYAGTRFLACLRHEQQRRRA